MSVRTDWASAIASRPQTMTSAKRATVPTNLRMRIDIAGSPSSHLQGDAAVYMVRAILCKQDDARTDQGVRCPFAASAAVAAFVGHDDIADADRGRCDTADGIRAFDRRMEACRRCAAATFRSRVANRVHEVPDDPAIS